MDNQQAKIEDIAWLAGFIDGEGSFCMIRSNAAHRNKQGELICGFVPRITICNTDWPTLDALRAVIDSLGFAYHVYEDLRTYEKPRQPKHNPRWHLSVQGMKRCAKWFPVLLPYLRTKKPQAELLLEYSLSRMAKPHICPFSPRELEILDIFRNPHSPQRLNAAKGGGQNSTPSKRYSPPPLET